MDNFKKNYQYEKRVSDLYNLKITNCMSQIWFYQVTIHMISVLY